MRRPRAPRTDVGLVAIAASILGCGGSSYVAKDPGAGLVAKNVAGRDGTVIAVACTPTGPELCFNANDDNCNGVIDEGCGSATGVLQFMAAWGDSPADVDLVVTDPAGSKITRSSPETASGLKLDKSCPEDCHGQNIENVYFAGNDPPRGRYVVEVKLVDARGAELPVKVHLSARVGSRTFSTDLTLSPDQGEDKRGFTFEL
ncbi:MAG: hypothetical protein FWD69_04915 [Polyangiaceae bacterium]|nr:hypothetical protein [Polyangiaceae bacterium]